jgi:hypothetical protein
LPPDKKILKTLEKAKTASPADAAKLFKEASDAAPDNAMVVYEFHHFTAFNNSDCTRQTAFFFLDWFERVLTSVGWVFIFARASRR